MTLCNFQELFDELGPTSIPFPSCVIFKNYLMNSVLHQFLFHHVSFSRIIWWTRSYINSVSIMCHFQDVFHELSPTSIPFPSCIIFKNYLMNSVLHQFLFHHVSFSIIISWTRSYINSVSIMCHFLELFDELSPTSIPFPSCVIFKNYSMNSGPTSIPFPSCVILKNMTRPYIPFLLIFALEWHLVQKVNLLFNQNIHIFKNKLLHKR